MRRVLATLMALLISGLLILGLTACSSDDPGLLPGDDAQQILSNLDRVEALATDGECTLALEAIETISRQIESLPGSVDSKLKQNLRRGVTRLSQVTTESCGVTEEDGPETDTTTETVPEPEDTVPEEVEGDQTGPTDDQAGGNNRGGNRGSGGGGAGDNRGQQPGRDNRPPNAGGDPGGDPGGGPGGGADQPGTGQPPEPDSGDTGGVSPGESTQPGGEENP